MKLSKTLSLISATNRLTPEQIQIFEKGLRKLDAGHSMNEVLEYLRTNNYPLIKDRDTPAASSERYALPAVGTWDEDTNRILVSQIFGPLWDAKPERAKEFMSFALGELAARLRPDGEEAE